MTATLTATLEQTVPAIRDEYTRRLDARRAVLARQRFWERLATEARLVVFAAGVIVTGLALGSGQLAPAWVAAPIGLFVGLLVVHSRAGQASRRAARAVAYYESGLARLDDRWAGSGRTGLEFLDPEHPYAADLDLFGPGSLFERLCTAQTRAGEETLAAWLLAPAVPDAIAERHEAIDDLRPRIDLAEALDLLGVDVRATLAPAALTGWGAAPPILTGRWVPLVAAVLAALNVAALAAWGFSTLGPGPFFLTLLLDGAFSFSLSKRVRRVLEPLERRGRDLALLARLLDRIEREPCDAPLLRRLRAALDVGAVPASRRIGRLARLLGLLEAQRNQVFHPIAALLLWSIQLAYLIDSWRVHYGRSIEGWLAVVGEFEALVALAGYARENPADPFPELDGGGPCFEGEGLGHPLIRDSACVRNDLKLDATARALIVSGSNMSGKSTMLRTVGVAAVLAQAGAPVRARRLRLSPLAIGASLRIQDSLQAGRSRFFAEIVRLRQVVDLARGPLPLLFLLDEILHGTNSHDRRIGAEALLRGLLDRGAIGLVTTHDLALADIAAGMTAPVANVHFEDRFEAGTLQFDYRMRPGVVRNSNALALMRSVGLDV